VPRRKTHLSKLAKAGTALFGGQWLEQYGAICYRRTIRERDYEVLLITSRGAGRWVIPKGGPMKGKTPRQVAAREAFEEAGVKGKVSKGAIGRYSYLKRLDDGQSVPCLVEVFGLEVGSIAGDFKEQGQRQNTWVPLVSAGRFVEEPELRGIFTRLALKLSASL
jgi:8-oxo-dGTP pyrophosphatase MutT (NUDIX family)